MINCVILCGGSGSRLWPLSREKLPKQLLPLVNEHTMLQNTILRFNKLSALTMPTRFTIICNIEHAFLVQTQINDLALPCPIQATIVAEPMGRDTAPAVAIAALLSNPEETTLIVPCDHVFDDDKFVESVQAGIPHSKNNIVTFGITPTCPETGYGYIKTDIATNATIEFVEKPNHETACKYVAAGNYYWNAGVFLFRNKDMLECFAKFEPDTLAWCKATLECSQTIMGILHLSKETFIKCTPISIDYAIMEKLCKDQDSSVKGITIPYKHLWCDVGSFKSLYELLLQDGENIQPYTKHSSNIVKGDVILHDTGNSYVETENAVVALVGVDNLVVVNTRDALLICDKNKSQDVKHVVNALKAQNRVERICHAKVYRPWGWYCNIEGNDTSGFKVKRIAVYPGKKLSLQSHKERSEHWVVVKGNAKVQVGHDQLILHANQHVYIPKKTLHRMENIGDELLEFVETQIGDYLGEDDIIRYEDDFGRV